MGAPAALGARVEIVEQARPRPRRRRRLGRAAARRLRRAAPGSRAGETVAPVVERERTGGGDGLDELAAAMGEACRIPAGRAVAEVELDLADVEPGLQRVDRHPHLAAEAARHREAGRPRSLAQVALARERLREQAPSPRLHDHPGGALRDPEAAALRPCERRDGEVAARLDQRLQVAVDVRVAEQQWPGRCDPLRSGERLALAEAWARHDRRARCTRALGRPVAGAVVGHHDLGVPERRLGDARRASRSCPPRRGQRRGRRA